MADSILRGKRILVVDDEPDVLESFKELVLADVPDCRIDEAQTYEQAISLIQATSYDLVVLDIMGVRGFDLLEAAVKRDFKVANGHEHLMSRQHLPKYLKAAENTGVARTLLVASSEYTMMGAGHDPAKGNDENSRELLEAARENPGRIVPFCTLHPSDPRKLEKLKQFVAEGAKGLKLYTGHGNFYTVALDAEDMMPVYAYCEETALPICWHVNITKYSAEFERVMQRHPKLIVIVPHFGVTFFRPRDPLFQHFGRLMDSFPNLYTDTSFGTREIMIGGFEAVSRDPDIFREFIVKRSDRILFGTDMVVTGNKEKTQEWIEAVLRACRDVLEKETYHCFMGARGAAYNKNPENVYGLFRGLALPDDVLKKIYETNFERLFPSSGTRFTRGRPWTLRSSDGPK